MHHSVLLSHFLAYLALLSLLTSFSLDSVACIASASTLWCIFSKIFTIFSMTSNRIIAFSLILTQLKGDNCHLTFRNLWLFCPINHNWKKPIFILRSQSFLDDVHWDTTRIFFLFPLFSLISNEVEFLASCYQCWQDGSQFSLPFTRLCQRLVKISQQFEEVCNLKRKVVFSRQEKILLMCNS